MLLTCIIKGGIFNIFNNQDVLIPRTWKFMNIRRKCNSKRRILMSRFLEKIDKCENKIFHHRINFEHKK